MRFSDALWWAWKSIREAKSRAVLCVVGVMIGAVLISAMANLGETYYATIKGIFIKGTNPTAIMVFPTRQPFTDADVALLTSIRRVRVVAPIMSTTCEVVGAGGTKYVQVLGLSEKLFKEIFPGVEVAEGSLIISPGTAVAGWRVAQGEVAKFLIPGTYAILRCGGGEVRVLISGVLKRVGFMLTTNLDNTLVTDKETLKLLGVRGYGLIVLVANSLDDVDYVAKEVSKLLPRSRASVVVIKYFLESIKNALNMLTLFLMAIAGVSTLVAGIGIAATMIMAVHQRAREVGVLKTFGFTKSDILEVFLIEALITGLIGGAIGMVLGIGLGYVIAANMIKGNVGTFHYAVSTTGEVVALTYSVVVALVAGAYPAWRASRLRPIEVLRYE